MNIDEKAKEILTQVIAASTRMQISSKLVPELRVDAIRAALLAVRNETLEEAAKAMEEYERVDGNRAAKVIRNLKEQP